MTESETACKLCSYFIQKEEINVSGIAYSTKGAYNFFKLPEGSPFEIYSMLSQEKTLYIPNAFLYCIIHVLSIVEAKAKRKSRVLDDNQPSHSSRLLYFGKGAELTGQVSVVDYSLFFTALLPTAF